MPTGAITGYIDVAQLMLYAFWIFFAGLIFYLRREDKREGYPLESDRSERSGRVSVVGFPRPPAPKTFHLPHGGTQTAPRAEPPQGEIAARPAAGWPGAPLVPTGNPLKDAVGPAAYARRSNKPDLTWEGEPKIVPLRVATDFGIASRDPDPRGMPVVAADGREAGTVYDVWVDRSEFRILYLEVELPRAAVADAEEASEAGEAEDTGKRPGRRRARRVMLPINFARVQPRHGRVKVVSLLAEQIAEVPPLARATQITLREEDRICAYYGGGHLYATPDRQEPWL